MKHADIHTGQDYLYSDGTPAWDQPPFYAQRLRVLDTTRFANGPAKPGETVTIDGVTYPTIGVTDATSQTRRTHVLAINVDENGEIAAWARAWMVPVRHLQGPWAETSTRMAELKAADDAKTDSWRQALRAREDQFDDLQARVGRLFGDAAPIRWHDAQVGVTVPFDVLEQLVAAAEGR